MTTDLDIDELLKQDEAALREKKKRLKALAVALDESRASATKAAAAAAESLSHGDLTRADLARVFALSKSEKASVLPALPRASVKPKSDAAQGVEEPDSGHHD